jgi:hypothetical protein
VENILSTNFCALMGSTAEFVENILSTNFCTISLKASLMVPLRKGFGGGCVVVGNRSSHSPHEKG